MKKKELFWGLFFILAAVLIIINQFGFFVEVSMFQLIATVILVGIIIKSIMYINFWGILFPSAVICILYAEEWDITNFTPWPALFTAFLLSLGLSLIFKRKGLYVYNCHSNKEFSENVVDEHDDNIINCAISFGETIKYVNSDNFEKAYIKSSFGEVKVYFDNAHIPSGKADINLDVSFGEAQIFIPKSWKVVNCVQVFFGEMGVMNNNTDSTSPVVTIHGNVSFGDAKIIYV